MARSILLLGCLLLTVGIGTAPPRSDDVTPIAQPGTPAPGTDLAAALDYCVAQGGIVRERHPVWGTNLTTDHWIQLGGSRRFCEFTGGAGADPGSWISLSVETLDSDLPTLASLAYLTKPPLPSNTGTANPSAVYCAQVLGGAYDWGGATGAGGGWVTFNSEPSYAIMNYCVFPDGSMIDAWGLTYHTGGVIRGADLTPRFRYQSDDPPRIFPGQS